MKYTKENLIVMQNKKMNAFKEWKNWTPFITIKNDCFIVESKINRGDCPIKLRGTKINNPLFK